MHLRAVLATKTLAYNESIRQVFYFSSLVSGYFAGASKR